MTNQIAVQTTVGFSEDGEHIVTSWTLGESTLTVSFPKDETRFRSTVKDLAFLCENIGELVDATSGEVERATSGQ